MAANQLRPTDAELAILQVLWTQGPTTVRQVHDALSGVRETGYTTTLKLMQIMAEKGLLQRDESQRAHVYRPAIVREDAQSSLLRSLMDRLFDGSSAQLVLRALAEKPATAEERRAIRKLIEEGEAE